MPGNNQKPYGESRMSKFLEKRVLELRPRKSQAQIAREAGFRTPNVLSMLKTGEAKVPLDRVPALAVALDTDPAHLFMLAVEQQDSTLTVVLRDIFRTVVSQNEAAWLEEIRDASDHGDPHMTTKAKKAIRGIFGK